MSIALKMYYPTLEYIVGNSYSNSFYHQVNYFSRNADSNYSFDAEKPAVSTPQYKRTTNLYQHQQYQASYESNHTFSPEIFLNPIKPKPRFIDDNSETRAIAGEIFRLMASKSLPDNISINILPFNEFRALHSQFGSWNNGIWGFSIGGKDKKIFARENSLDSLMIVIGHEIGHVLTEQLPNKHDEEAKAFAFTIEWAKTIKMHNVANLGLSIKDDLDFQPARNGLHDVAFGFVDFMVKRGRKALQLHNDLVKRYVSVFDRVY